MLSFIWLDRREVIVVPSGASGGLMSYAPSITDAAVIA
jgi:hypothetical protein